MDFDGIRLEDMQMLLDNQIRITKEIESTKAYKTIEAYHFWKAQTGAGKVQSIGRALRHMRGQIDEEIVAQDPLSALLTIHTELGCRMDEMSNVLEKHVSFVEVMQSLWEMKMQGKKIISIFAPYEDINLPDGYCRRVKNVDGLLEDDVVRVYIAKIIGAELSVPKCSIVSERYISIRYNENNKEQCMWISLIAHLVGVAYIHSVYQAVMPVLKNDTIIKFYDFHGVVPEELLFMERSGEAKYYNEYERELVLNADYIIVANHAMEKHIVTKYPTCVSEFIVMPMNNDDNNYKVSPGSENLINSKPIVIYSGGLQKWQLISEMQDAISKLGNECEFHLYVPDVNGFMQLWGERKKPDVWEVATKTPEELKEEYTKAQYGFVLRNDIVVNRVACPTKIIDYIKYGIIPIMKFTEIGDFGKYGINYISLDDFLNGIFPTEDKRLEMCYNNLKVLENILGEYETGRDKVKNIIKEIL